MKKLAYFFLLILCLGQSFDLRGQFIADRFTNRPLTLMNDATSVGWNPAVLGMTGKTDVVLVVPYDRSWQNTRLIGAFASSQGVGLGYTSVRHERLPDISYVPFSFYGGVGSKIPGYNVWAGASFRYSEFGGRTVRYSGSLIYNPYDKLYLSAGMSNLYSVDTRDMVYQASATYSLLDWLTMHGRLQYCAENPIFWGEKYSSEFGIVAAINKKRIISSFSVNPVAREARFGLEVAFDVFSIGVLSEGSTLNTPGGRFNGGNILLRVNHDSIYANEHYRCVKDDCKSEQCEVIEKCSKRECSGIRCKEAVYPAYRCIRVQCPGTSCTRFECDGLTCGDCYKTTTISVEKKITTSVTGNCADCSSKTVIVTDTIIRRESGGSSVGGGNTGGSSSSGGTSSGGTSSGGNSGGGTSGGGGTDDGTTAEEPGKESGKKSTKPDTNPTKKEDTNDDSGSDPDAWEDNGGEETPESEEVEEGDPFEEVEDPISENVQKPNNTNTAQNNNGGKGGIGKSYKLRRVFFDHDKWDIKPESVDELNKLKSYLSKNSDLCVRLDAHTDSNGSNEYNKELSRKRAQSVVDYLIENGIDPVRLSAQGFGEEFPVTTNDTPEGREENRRVEFTKIGC
jgi:outer membrane protein OmpA-like peptidoglycan-associated protein